MEYTCFDNVGRIENITNLANDPNITGKQFAIRLYGSVGTSQADSDFANKRAQKLKAELVANGTPAEKILIHAPQAATDYTQTPSEIDKQTDRVVVMFFEPTCTGAGTAGSTGRESATSTLRPGFLCLRLLYSSLPQIPLCYRTHLKIHPIHHH